MAGITNVTNQPCRKLRLSTVEKTKKSQDEPVKLARKILAENASAWLGAVLGLLVVEREVTEAKVHFRMGDIYIQWVVEKILGVPFKRGHTSMQGSQAPKGWQAAHGSLYPSTRDAFINFVIDYVVINGLTPKKSKPFLIASLGLTPDDIQMLEQNQHDKAFLQQFIYSRLPKEGKFSVFAGTSYEKQKNATFNAPNESNEYDSLLERTIKPFLEELQALRLDGTDTVEESMKKLADWLADYYMVSIVNITAQLENIETLETAYNEMRTFELENLETEELDRKKFKLYLKNVSIFVDAHEKLMRTEIGRPKCHALKWIRNDFSHLKKLASASKEKAPDIFRDNRRHLAGIGPFVAAPLLKKYELFLDEAKAQRKANKHFLRPCAINKLQKFFFGVMENNVRRRPTETELYAQAFKICEKEREVKAQKQLKFESPVKAKRSRDDDSNQNSPKKPRL